MTEKFSLSKIQDEKKDAIRGEIGSELSEGEYTPAEEQTLTDDRMTLLKRKYTLPDGTVDTLGLLAEMNETFSGGDSVVRDEKGNLLPQFTAKE